MCAKHFIIETYFPLIRAATNSLGRKSGPNGAAEKQEPSKRLGRGWMGKVEQVGKVAGARKAGEGSWLGQTSCDGGCGCSLRAKGELLRSVLRMLSIEKRCEEAAPPPLFELLMLSTAGPRSCELGNGSGSG